MFDLPKSTVFGRPIPKKKFYDKLNVPTRLKQVFVEQIDRITWQNKIAPPTANIAASETVQEIHVFSIRLNQRGLDKRILPLLDKGIPYNTLFLLEHSDDVQAWIGYKEQGKIAGPYYHTEWLTPEALNLRLDGLNMDTVYANFLRQIAGGRLDGADIGIEEAIRRDEQRQELQKQIAALEKKIRNEKQFNKQVELNAELKRLKQWLVGSD